MIYSTLTVQHRLWRRSRDGRTFYAFYHFAAPDPTAVVAAMDKFWALTGKKYPADKDLIRKYLMGVPVYHFINNTFKNAADQQEALKS